MAIGFIHVMVRLVGTKLKTRLDFKKMDLIDAIHVARNEHPLSKFAAVNAGFTDDSDTRAIDLYSTPGASFAAINKDRTPVAIGGVFADRPHRFSAWMMPSTFFKRSYWPDMLVFMQKLVEITFYENPKVIRIEAIIYPKQAGTDWWIQRDELGFTLDGYLKNYGKDGSTYHLYSTERKYHEK